MITSGNQLVRFPIFQIIRFLLLHSVYCNVFFLIDVSGHSSKTCQWWPCLKGKCVHGPQRLEKNLTFLRCIHLWDLVLKSCYDINEGNWIQPPFIFAVLAKTVASFVGMSLFHLWVTFQVEVLSYRTLAETFEKGFQNRFYLENINFGKFG